MPYDRWHKSRPKAGDPVCKEHGKAPTRDHGVGKRWQARWRDPEGVQQTELFAKEVDAKKHETKCGPASMTGPTSTPRPGRSG